MANLEGQSLNGAKKQKRRRGGRLSFEEVEDKFFPHPNPCTLITRDDWDRNQTVADPEIQKLWDSYAGKPDGGSIDRERLIRHMDMATKREEIEYNKINQKSIAAASFCLVDEVPTYPPQVIQREGFVQGQRLSVQDVLSLLSNDGRRDYLLRCSDGQRVDITQDLVQAKHLVICCFFVPLLSRTEQAALCHALIEAYTSLDFEMVIVAKVRKSKLESDEQLLAFQRFIQAFPCLAIPYEDSYSRDNLCLTLGMTYSEDISSYTPDSLSGLFSAGLVISPDQIVLQTDVGFFLHYGTSSFPFTPNRLETLAFEDNALRYRMDPYYLPPLSCRLGADADPPTNGLPKPFTNPISLGELLSLDPASELRNPNGEVLSLSALCNRRCVALYLCVSGTLLPMLNETHQQCLAHHLQFEVVVVCLFNLFNPPHSIESVHQALRQLNVPSWWVLPFASDLTRRMWRLVDRDLVDKLIFVEDGGRSWEFNGGVMLDYGVEGHPFTTRAITEQKFAALRSLTLDELLQPFRAAGIHLIRNKQYDDMALAELKGKRVLVCFAFLDSRAVCYDFFVPLMDSYNKIQAAGGEVLYILLSDRPADYSDHDIAAMPWLQPPLNPPIGAAVADQLCLRFGYSLMAPRILAFGEDGMICSINAHDHLSSGEGVPDRLFNDNQQCLREEIRKEVLASLHY